MSAEKSANREWKLVGGELCLDFANTADWHASDSPHEQLRTYEDLVDWAIHSGILDKASGEQLLLEAARHPSAARGVLKRAVTLRESLYRIFVAAVAAQTPDAANLNILNEELARALRRLRLTCDCSRWAWDWKEDDRALDSMLWPVVRSAADVLTSHKHAKVGQCADDRGCGWLFLDLSKNRSRRWCAMEDCGNRAKVLRHYRLARSPSFKRKV
ncbi:MAG: ABATE domain-containing protein [Candidatus Eiseniibacteriota bacterium]|nr:MAG: ABATE domain-containing protein [Candidatus Eisenbacteria bacterium]